MTPEEAREALKQLEDYVTSRSEADMTADENAKHLHRLALCAVGAFQVLDELVQFRRDALGVGDLPPVDDASWPGWSVPLRPIAFELQVAGVVAALRAVRWSDLDGRSKGLWRMGLGMLEHGRRANLEFARSLVAESATVSEPESPDTLDEIARYDYAGDEG